MKSLLFLALAAHSTLASYTYPYAPGGSYGLKLRPPFVTMANDNDYGIPVYISLKTQPKGKATVFFELPHFVASRCRLDFTPKNWNKEQIIRITRLPFLTAADANRVTEGSFLAVAVGEKYHKKRQKFQVIRSGGAGATCSALGDPHYTTFAGRAHHFQGLGAYYLIKSSLLTIQQFNIPFGPNPAAVQNMIAIRYHKTVYVFNADTTSCNLASDVNENVEILSIPGLTWRVVLSDGTVINMSRATCFVNFMNVDITIGTLYKGQLSGLCGLYNVPANGAFTMSNNAATEDINAFGNSWAVPANDNLFVLGDKAACLQAAEDNEKGLGAEDFCAFPAPEELDGDTDGQEDYNKGEEVIEDPEKEDPNVINQKIKKVIGRPVIPERAPADEWATQARTNCVKLLTIKEANDILDPKIYVDDCIDDCVLSGTFDFIDTAKERYMVAVRRFTNSVLDEPAIRDGVNRVAEGLKKKAKDVAEKVGLNEAECPDDCGENGTCTPHGCDCDEGYHGIDCSEENPENPAQKKAFTTKAAVPRKAQDVPQPRLMGDLRQAEKLEAANQAKKLKDAGKN